MTREFVHFRDILKGNIAAQLRSEAVIGWTTGVSSSAKGSEDLVKVIKKLGIKPDHAVQEFGWDDDCDEALRGAVEDLLDDEIVDEDFDDVVDVVLLWWREYDGDLVDALVDAITALADQGVIWLLTPKPGRDGHVEPADIADAAPTAGLQQTSTLSAAKDWQGTRLVAKGAARK